MNDKKIDINGSVADSIKGLAGTALGLIVVTVIIGVLFAPALAVLFEPGIRRRNTDNNGNINYEIVRAQMTAITCLLFLVALTAWGFVIYINLYTNF